MRFVPSSRKPRNPQRTWIGAVSARVYACSMALNSTCGTEFPPRDTDGHPVLSVRTESVHVNVLGVPSHSSSSVFSSAACALHSTPEGGPWRYVLVKGPTNSRHAKRGYMAVVVCDVVADVVPVDVFDVVPEDVAVVVGEVVTVEVKDEVTVVVGEVVAVVVCERVGVVVTVLVAVVILEVVTDVVNVEVAEVVCVVKAHSTKLPSINALMALFKSFTTS